MDTAESDSVESMTPQRFFVHVKMFAKLKPYSKSRIVDDVYQAHCPMIAGPSRLLLSTPTNHTLWPAPVVIAELAVGEIAVLVAPWDHKQGLVAHLYPYEGAVAVGRDHTLLASLFPTSSARGPTFHVALVWSTTRVGLWVREAVVMQ